MFKSIIAAAFITSVLASGAMAATAAAPAVAAPVVAAAAAKPVAPMVHKASMKKITHVCKKGTHIHKGKCVK